MLRWGMTTQQHLAQHDKQIGAIRDLVREGMKLVIETRRDIRETRREMREMLQAQKRTEKNLAELIAGSGALDEREALRPV
jgi:Spy/CpxP family protein refolding chaperone